MTSTVRVAAIDDHPIFLAGLRDALDGLDGIEVLATGHDTADAERIASERQTDVMLLDIAMPGGGIEVIGMLLALHPALKIIMLTASEDDATVAAAIGFGALGYVVKGCAVEELRDAIAAVHSGTPFITQSISSRLLVRALRPERTSNQGIASRYKLNHRESTVIDLVANGMSNKQISSMLNLAHSTVRNALSSAFAKLQVENRLQAVVKWYSNVQPDH